VKSNKPSIVDKLAGKYRHAINSSNLAFEEIKAQVMQEAMREKYGLSSYEALTLISNKNIDFGDALICAKSKLQNYGKLSFDNDTKSAKSNTL